MKITDFLPSGLGPNPPVLPLVSWPLPMRLVPKTREIAAGLYEAAYFLGYADGVNTGLAVGIPLGMLVSIASISLIYWAFFKKVRTR